MEFPSPPGRGGGGKTGANPGAKISVRGKIRALKM